MELPLTEGNPLAPLVIALQEEIAQLKEEIRKRDSVCCNLFKNRYYNSI